MKYDTKLFGHVQIRTEYVRTLIAKLLPNGMNTLVAVQIHPPMPTARIPIDERPSVASEAVTTVHEFICPAEFVVKARFLAETLKARVELIFL